METRVKPLFFEKSHFSRCLLISCFKAITHARDFQAQLKGEALRSFKTASSVFTYIKVTLRDGAVVIQFKER